MTGQTAARDADGAGFSNVYVSATDGLRLHARDYGDRASEQLPVVCLPGLTRNAHDFHALALALASHRHRPRRVVAVDYRGRGLSDWDADWARYDVVVETQDVATLLDAMGVPEAVFVGTSRGGLCTMALSAIRPAAIRGVVLNDIGPVIDAKGLLRIRATVGKLPPPRSLAEAVDMLKRVSDARFPGLTEEDWLALAEGSWRTPARAAPGAALEPTFDPALMKPLAKLDLEAPLPPLWPLFNGLLNVPVLAIRGENSDLLSPETLDAMAKAHPRLETLTVPGQGHAPLLRDAASIARIASFLAAVEDAPRAVPADQGKAEPQAEDAAQLV